VKNRQHPAMDRVMEAFRACTHPQQITFGEMRESGVRGVLIYCSDHHCSHLVAISADQWPDDVRLSDIEDHGHSAAVAKLTLPRSGDEATLGRTFTGTSRAC
jgi:hypothetical protein